MPRWRMTSAPILQFTSVRTRIVGSKTLIGLKHTAKTSAGLPVTTTWVEMPPEDVEADQDVAGHAGRTGPRLAPLDMAAARLSLMPNKP